MDALNGKRPQNAPQTGATDTLCVGVLAGEGWIRVAACSMAATPVRTLSFPDHPIGWAAIQVLLTTAATRLRIAVAGPCALEGALILARANRCEVALLAAGGWSAGQMAAYAARRGEESDRHAPPRERLLTTCNHSPWDLTTPSKPMR